MGTKKTYWCNICEEKTESPNSSLYGIHFNSNNNFTLGGYGCTDGKHICYECAKQITKHFNAIHPELREEIDYTP
jgi:hypothetical protein